jgi:hypothetical protein
LIERTSVCLTWERFVAYERFAKVALRAKAGFDKRTTGQSNNKLDMKALQHIRYLLSTLVVLLALVGCSRKPETPHSDINALRYRDFLLHAQTDALQARIVLTDLREGRTTNALELLEVTIDSSVVMIDHSLTNLSGWERDSAMGTLRVLKAYRAAHPRQREAVIQDLDKADLERLTRATQEAPRILSDLK